MAFTIALVGCGAMGSALLKGLLTLEDSVERFEKIWVVAPHREKVEPFMANSRVEWFSSPQELKQEPDILIFAVKPQLLEEILPLYASYQRSLIISLATGKSLSFYQNILDPSTPLIRAMPNTPVEVHQGVIGLLTQASLTENQQAMVKACFQGLGYCLWVNEDDELDRLTAISGSGPAYVFRMMEALTHSAEALGFDKETALDLSRHTFLGAAMYAQQSVAPPALLRQHVTSPQGTTAAALNVLETGGLGTLMDRAIEAAYKRAKELHA